MKVVAIGGGHGLSASTAALRKIKEVELSAIVGTTDNGGSTGDIRRWSNCIAWGDLRHVINNLSELKPPTLQSRLFEFRFEDHEGPLSGQSLGNLMLHAMEHIAERPQEALDLVCDWLDVDARIIPMSEEVVDLLAEAGPEHVVGETQIDHMARLPDLLKLTSPVSATQEAISAIESADLVVLGPGSVMTSVLPSLLVPDIQAALQSAKCPKLWIQNQGHEEGPMGRLTPEATHHWLDKILGFEYCSVILADHSTSMPEVSKKVIRCDLKDENHPSTYSISKLTAEFQLILNKG